MKRISSRDNPLAKELRALAGSARERRKQGRTLLDGAHVCRAYAERIGQPESWLIAERALASAEIRGLLARADERLLVLLADALFDELSPVETPSGIAAVIAIPPQAKPALAGKSCVVLEAIQDAGNLGAILRTCAAAGIGEVLLTEGCAQAWSPKVLRAAMGAHFALHLHEHVEPAQALEGYDGAVLATAPDAPVTLHDMDLGRPVAWLFGNEGAGLSEQLAARATQRVRIPMPGAAESLNVAAAVAVCLFEQVRQEGSGQRSSVGGQCGRR